MRISDWSSDVCSSDLGQRVHGRTIIVRRLKDASPAGCNLLFAGESSDLDPDILSGKAARPILTVTDRSKGVAGGMIEFVMQGGRVRFQIDERAARASGLRISSKLLRSEEHTSELQSLMRNSKAGFVL